MVDFQQKLQEQRAAADDPPTASQPPPVTPPVTLSPSQARALEVLQSGTSCFVTGVAGTGKSFLLRQWLQAPGRCVRGVRTVAVTATTGLAALQVGGVTINRWAGIGLGDEPAEKIVMSRRWRDWIAPRIYRADALVIEEVSMARASLIDLVDQVCREARLTQAATPFGGLQVVFLGDLGQLPPVDRKNDTARLYPFEADAWQQLQTQGMRVCRLTEAMRQQDQDFVGLLNRARLGLMTADDERVILGRRITPPDDAHPVHIVATNAQAQEINRRALDQLPGDATLYEAVIWAEHDSLAAQLARDCPSPEFLHLKVGARVVCTINDPDGQYVNGSLGTVEELSDSAALVRLDRHDTLVRVAIYEWVCTERDGDYVSVVASMRQLPLKLAWGLTVHRTQGMTLDSVRVDLSKTFTDGQAYVALSRVRSLAGLYLDGWCGRGRVTMHPRVRAWCLAHEGVGSMLEGIL